MLLLKMEIADVTCGQIQAEMVGHASRALTDMTTYQGRVNSRNLVAGIVM